MNIKTFSSWFSLLSFSPLLLFSLCFVSILNILVKHFHFYLGGCINASPAGKRRIANEQQQFGDDNLFGITGKLSIVNDENDNNGYGSIISATTPITAIALTACALIISLFAIIFIVLQVNTIFHFSFLFSVYIFKY